MKLRRIPVIPNFDSHHFANVSCNDAERIYSNGRIKMLMRAIETLNPEAAQQRVFFDICNELSSQSSSSPYIFTKETRLERGERSGTGTVCLVHRDASPSYKKVHVVGQLDHSPATASETGRILARRVRDIFTEQGFRLHLFAFSLHQTKMRTFAFARYGACSSDEFDIVMNPVRFVRALTSFLRMNKDELGYDPTHTVRPDGSSALLVADKVYRVDSCIYSSTGYSGRATSIWKATTATGETVVIKDCYPTENRRQEGEMLKQAATSEAPFLLDADNRRQHHIDGWTEPRRFAAYIDHERVKHRNPIFVNANSKPPGRCVRSGHARSSSLDHDKSLNREHRRVVVKYLEYKRIEDLISTPLDLFTAVRDCIDGHWALYRAGVLHRDVSKDNLMAAIKKEGQRLDFGFMIDLDFAAEDGLSTRAGLREPFATGNKQFMASEVLHWLSDCQLSYEYYQSALRHGDSGKAQKLLTTYKLRLSGFKQEYRHDLESFYWVLLWCLFQMSYIGEVKMTVTFNNWKDPSRTFLDVFNAKSMHFYIHYKGPGYFKGLVGLDSATAEVTFGSLLVSLTKVLSNYEALAALPAEELYCRFQRALTEIIEFFKDV